MNTASRQRGISIIEVLVSLLILGGGILGLIRLQTFMSDGASTAKQRTEATKLAQKKIEELRSFTTAAAFDLQFAGTTPTTCAAVTVSGENTSYTVSCAATLTDATSLSGRMAALTVTVAWKDQKAQDQSVQLQTTVTRLAPANAGLLLTPAPSTTIFCAGGAVKTWTVGSTTCQGTIGSAGSDGTVVPVASTTNSGDNQYQCTATGWVESTGFAKTCVASCTGTTKTWSGAGGEQCSANLATTLEGQSLAVTDSTTPVTGTATYQCQTGGVWATSPNAGSTCVAVCPGEPVDWNPTGQTLTQCQGSLAARTFSSGGANSTSFNNSTTSGTTTITATATYACANTGSWSLTSSACSSSTPPPTTPTNCSATDVTWGTSPTTCSGSLALANVGTSSNTSQSSGTTFGNATYSCNTGGTWALTTQTCSKCTVSVSGQRQSDATAFWLSADGTSYTQITGSNGSCTVSSAVGNGNKTEYFFSCTAIPISGNTGINYTIKSTASASGANVGVTDTFRTSPSAGATCGGAYTTVKLCSGNAC